MTRGAERREYDIFLGQRVDELAVFRFPYSCGLVLRGRDDEFPVAAKPRRHNVTGMTFARGAVRHGGQVPDLRCRAAGGAHQLAIRAEHRMITLESAWRRIACDIPEVRRRADVGRGEHPLSVG